MCPRKGLGNLENVLQEGGKLTSGLATTKQLFRSLGPDRDRRALTKDVLCPPVLGEGPVTIAGTTYPGLLGQLSFSNGKFPFPVHFPALKSVGLYSLFVSLTNKGHSFLL